MKTILRLNQQRLHKEDAWKKSAYAFVPFQTHFGELCGFADDIVMPGQGFGMHPHKNMEITTVMVKGIQAHKDNTGNEALVTENMVQTMSAGTGIMHSEYNASATESFHSYQIWIYPKIMDVKPRHETFTYTPNDTFNKILLTVSPDQRNNTALINQDAFFSVAFFEKNKFLVYNINLKGNGVYMHCISGSVQLGQQVLHPGDALGVYETEKLTVEALENSELIFVEVPMQRGIQLE